MNILQINKFYFPAGGADQSMLELSQALCALGHTVVPFAMEHPKNLPTEWSRFFPSFVETERISDLWSGMRTLTRMMYSREAQKKLEELFSEFTPDVAHVHNIYHQLSPSIFATLKKRHIPIVMTVHDHKLVSPLYALEEQDETFIGHPWKEAWHIIRRRRFKHSGLASLAIVLETAVHRMLKIYRAVDLFIAPSVFMRDLLVRAGYPENRIRVIPHGTALPVLSPAERGDHFLFVGRLRWEKGCDLLLEVARLAPHIPIQIIGSGLDEEKFKAFAREHHLSNVRFLGSVPHDRIPELVARARGVVVPSRFLEPFGLAALEALASATPVIAARVGALPELVADQRTGLLFAPGDARDLSAKLQWAADHPAEFAKFGKSGRIVAEGHAFAKQLSSILAIYDELQHS